MKSEDINLSSTQESCDVEFALIQMQQEKVKPLLLRLDGIYFNSDQNYDQQNFPIRYAYERADTVVFQSNFNKQLTEHWFGKHTKSVVIHNAADIELINSVPAHHFNETIDRPTEIWSCASSWRPHKRLDENLRYFCERAPRDAMMLVAGENASNNTLKKYHHQSNGRIFYLGTLDYERLISLYKQSTTFVHLAYLDHCPNVVVDAQAAGCKIVCSSSGGTKEVVSKGLIINEPEWDFDPIKLYDPPTMNFNNFLSVRDDTKYGINDASCLYEKVFRKLIK